MDAGIDGIIRYSIANEQILPGKIFSILKYFQINSTTGEIFLMRALPLQYEKLNTVYRIFGIASSGSKANELSSNSLIYFEVKLYLKIII